MIITDHALKQASYRVYEYRGYTEHQMRNSIMKRLSNACFVGNPKRPGNAIEVTINDISFVLRYSIADGDWVVITCLGDSQYRRWYRGELKKRNYTMRVYA